MKSSRAIFTAFCIAPAVAFTTCPSSVAKTTNKGLCMADTPFFSTDIAKALDREVSYQPGKADTPFARKYGHLAGANIRTVGEAFTAFTDILGTPVNALYKGICTDLVGTLHLVMVNARFQSDAVFNLGLVAVLDLVLKNYPERDAAARIKTALIESVGLDEATIDADAAKLAAWAEGKTREEIASALKGEGDSFLADVAREVKENEWWMYSRFFGIGLIKIMEVVGIEQDMSVSYDVMEDWMGNCLGKPHYTACSDSDLYFKQKGKLDMMETMMKEIEIREKKRMADRLEAKAEMAILAAEKAEKLQNEVDAEKVKEEETVDA